MKPSKIDICNTAISYVGDHEIRSLDESSTASILCNRFYDVDRRWLLTKHNWAFARRRSKLRVLETPSNETIFAYAYQIPSDSLLPRLVEPGGSKVKWQVYGNELHTDLKDACLIYTADIDNTDLFSSIFSDLLILRIARKLANPLSQDNERAESLLSEFRTEFELGIHDDAEIGSEYKHPDLVSGNDPLLSIDISASDAAILAAQVNQTNN